MKKDLIKKILSVVFTLVLGVGAGFLLWLVAMDGSETLKEKSSSLPSSPQNLYDGFYYSSLSSDEKIAYECIMDKIEEMPKKIRVPILDEEGLSDVFEALLYDNPTFFFLSENCKTETNNFGNCYFIPEYTMNLYEYDEMISELEEIKDGLNAALADCVTDYDKELVIHDYVVDKCEYVSKTGGTYSSVYGCLAEGSASCEGYAKAIKYLLDEAGIENYLAVGTVEGETPSSRSGHAWNIVKIDGEYYHLDATWNDPVNEDEIESYAYFNVSDEEILLTHDVEKRFLGKCTAINENYYVKNGIYFTEYDGETRAAVASEIARQARLDKSYASFKLADGEALKSAKEALFDMNGIYSILLSASLMTEKTLSQNKIMYSVDDKHNIITLWDFVV